MQDRLHQYQDQQQDINNDLDSSINVVEPEEYDKCYECPVCYDLLVSPITLLCQHTFCKQCIKSYVKKQKEQEVDSQGFQIFKDKHAKCPLCKCTIIVPVNENTVLIDIIKEKYPELYASRLEYAKKESMKEDLRSEVESELRRELFDGVLQAHVENNQFGTNIGDNLQNTRVRATTSPYVNVGNTGSYWYIREVIGGFALGMLAYILLKQMYKLFTRTSNYPIARTLMMIIGSIVGLYHTSINIMKI